MAGTRRYLENIKVDIEDRDYGSKYFNVSNFNYILTSGKNSITLDGSNLLKADSEIVIEVLDNSATSLYTELARKYNEGTGIVISILVDKTIIRGSGVIIIIGTDVNGKLVRWSQKIQINTEQKNITQVRFYKSPTFEITPYINDTAEYTFEDKTATGDFFTLAKNPIIGFNWNTFDKNRNKVEYKLIRKLGDVFKSDMIGETVQLSSGQSIEIKNVKNKDTIEFENPIIENGKVIAPTGTYSISYKNQNTAIGALQQDKKISTVKVTFKNIETFTGNVTQYKIYRKSKGSPYESECISSGKIYSNEILSDPVTPFANKREYGKFYSIEHINDYWKSDELELEYSNQFFSDSISIKGASENVSSNEHVILKLNTLYSNDTPLEYINFDTVEYINNSGSSYDSNSIELFENVSYSINCDVAFQNKQKSAALCIYFISNHPNIIKSKLYDGYGIKIVEIKPKESTSVEIQYVEELFELQQGVIGTLSIVPKNCDVDISNLSIKPYTNYSINPDSFSTKIPFDVRIKNESFEISAELLDDENNIVYGGLKTTKTFDSEGITYPFNYLAIKTQFNSQSIESITSNIDALFAWSSSFAEVETDCCAEFLIVSSSYAILSQSYATGKKWSEL